MSAVVSVEHVTKSYRLGVIGSATVQEDLARWWAKARRKPDPTLRVGQFHARRVGHDFWALEDVNFAVTQGEVLGIVGRNGAGKSTLLKILSQVTAPTSGQIRLRGRVASLLEVGTGFHPDLTGRENVFLNGAILGMTKAEVRSKFDEIVAFSECEEFIDTPVKRYSSGMYVRLAFAVAAHLEPEILIVDEVLAVGDITFQQKCLGRMREVSKQGRTILFVSHNLSAISALCTRAILLADGHLKVDDETAAVIAAYQQARVPGDGSPAISAGTRRQGTGKGKFTSLSITAVDAQGKLLQGPISGCDLVVETRIDCFADFSAAQVAVVLFDGNRSRIIDVNTALHGEFLSLNRGESATVTFALHDLLLKPGVYYVMLWLGRGAIEEIDYIEDAGSWRMNDTPSARHTETFPGVYQCRFTHAIKLSVGSGEGPLQ